jgi:hypothetical protein
MRTIQWYREGIEEYLRSAFDKVKLDELSALGVEEIHARILKDGILPSTIGLINAVLSSALKRAARLKLITHNVCTDVRTP